jgi:DNA-binding MarR family transcriptional regulator
MSGIRDRKTAVANRNGGGTEKYLLHRQIGFMLRLAFQHHTTIFTSRMIGDLTQPQYAVLWMLREVGECSQNKLGRLVALDSATIKGVVNRLEQRGLIRALGDPEDRRRLVLSLTREGTALVKRAEKVAVEITEVTLDPLTKVERLLLLQLLERIYTPPTLESPKG